MKELCDERSAGRGTRAILHDSGLTPRFWVEAMTTFMYTSTTANEGKMPYELFHRMKSDVGHMRTFGCVVKVTLPSETLGKLDNWAAMGYLLGYRHGSGYRVWIPRVGIRESSDVVFNEGTAPTTMGQLRSGRTEPNKCA